MNDDWNWWKMIEIFAWSLTIINDDWKWWMMENDKWALKIVNDDCKWWMMLANGCCLPIIRLRDTKKSIVDFHKKETSNTYMYGYKLCYSIYNCICNAFHYFKKLLAREHCERAGVVLNFPHSIRIRIPFDNAIDPLVDEGDWVRVFLLSTTTALVY